MIEVGLAVCAACLPAQYCLFNKKGLQSIVNSVQSAISLRSLRSASNRGSPTATGYIQSKTEPWTSDTENMITHFDGSSRPCLHVELEGIRKDVEVTSHFENLDNPGPVTGMALAHIATSSTWHGR